MKKANSTHCIFFLLIFSFIFLNHSFCQDIPDVSQVNITPSKGWQLHFAPTINYRFLKTTPENQWIIDAKNEIEIPAIGCNFGMNRFKKISKRLEVGLGINYDVRRINTKKIDLLWNDMQLQPAGKIKRFYSYHYLEFPLHFTFFLNKKQTNLLGVSISLYGSFTDGGNNRETIWLPDRTKQKNNHVNVPYYFGENIGSFSIYGGKRWKLNKNLGIRCEPIFTVTTSATERSPFQSFFYSFAIKTTLEIFKQKE